MRRCWRGDTARGWWVRCGGLRPVAALPKNCPEAGSDPRSQQRSRRTARSGARSTGSVHASPAESDSAPAMRGGRLIERATMGDSTQSSTHCAATGQASGRPTATRIPPTAASAMAPPMRYTRPRVWRHRLSPVLQSPTRAADGVSHTHGRASARSRRSSAMPGGGSNVTASATCDAA